MGIFPYVLKLLQTTNPELRQILVFIWTKILALDKVKSELPFNYPTSTWSGEKAFLKPIPKLWGIRLILLLLFMFKMSIW